jgi:hypothetical protein
MHSDKQDGERKIAAEGSPVGATARRVSRRKIRKWKRGGHEM